MRTWAKGSASAAFLAAGVMALGSGTAFADTDGSHSVLGGNQVDIPVTLPIDISGNAVAVAGDSRASSQGGAAVQGEGVGAGQNKTSGAGSILGGNQVEAPINVPVNACGNAVSVIGRSDASCRGGAAVKSSGRHASAGGNRTSGVHSIGGGNQVVAPITAPINLCGNSIAVFGNATAGCRGGAFVGGGRDVVRAGGNRTSGHGSILGGNQVVAPIAVPVNVCGNSVAVIGKAFSGCTGGSSVGGSGGHGGHGHGGHGHGGYGGHHGGGHWHRPGSTGHDTDSRYSVGSGTQVITPITTPADVCGNGSGSCHGGSTPSHGGRGHGGHGHGGYGGGAGGNRTSGVHSVGGGNQVVAPITAPINVCGNAVAIVGHAFAGCRGGATAVSGWSKHGGRGAGGNVTSGHGSILGGNQIVAPITAPINICGNAVSVIGKSQAGCQGGASVLGGGVGAGGNITSGKHGILAGNQIVAPITAPINICGNSVAVLGDAAAGCLGGAQVGGGWKSHGHWAHQHKAARGGAMSAMPGASVLSGKHTVQPMSAAATPSAPVVGDLPNMLGLPETPSLPAAPAAKGKKAGSTLDGATRSLPTTKTLEDATASLPVADTARNLPTGDLGKSAGVLPLDKLSGLKLMSAEQPVGLTGMNPASFLALALGAMFAASASLFAVTRRFRFGRK
ncbi:chaplin family protein [Microbispora bryophytorum]|uniref:Chaplin n=1 Tax=Microbispora bryophytorum subsp. camponoti TaxID=1677852 RepID=A0ABR8L3U6_9ACTN|nr:chaplin family protein [Microbispora camponoti]MBD3145627.1 chaplin [Microbispora camponoti]